MNRVFVLAFLWTLTSPTLSYSQEYSKKQLCPADCNDCSVVNYQEDSPPKKISFCQRPFKGELVFHGKMITTELTNKRTERFYYINGVESNAPKKIHQNYQSNETKQLKIDPIRPKVAQGNSQDEPDEWLLQDDYFIPPTPKPNPMDLELLRSKLEKNMTSGKGHNPNAHKDWIYSMAFNPEKKELYTASQDTTIGIWDLSTNLIKKTIKAHDNGVSTLLLLKSTNQLVSSSFDGEITLWKLPTLEKLKVMRGHQHKSILNNFRNSISVSTDGNRLYSADTNGRVILWNLQAGEKLRQKDLPNLKLKNLQVSTDHKYLKLTVEKRPLLLLDPMTLDEKFTVDNAIQGSYNFFTSKNSSILFIKPPKSVSFLNLNEKSVNKELTLQISQSLPHIAKIHMALTSPDKSTILLLWSPIETNINFASLYQLKTGDRVADWFIPEQFVESFTFISNKIAAFATHSFHPTSKGAIGRYFIYLFDVFTGKEERRFGRICSTEKHSLYNCQ